jgi:uncharacterized protein with NRDE domain
MCLLFFAANQHPDYRLVIAANRDEYYRRPTDTARFWADAPHVLGGRDLEQGGTWLGITRDGRWGAVTNYREVGVKQHNSSRGHLIRDYLVGGDAAEQYIDKIRHRADRYAGFNLIIADATRVTYYSNRGGDPRVFNEGVYGLSNHLLDSPWPKLTEGKNRLMEILVRDGDPDADSIFLLLGDQRMAMTGLPDTGVGDELERLLSPAFISSGDYGTRSSTVILVDQENRVQFIERSFQSSGGRPPSPENYQATSHQFTIVSL